MAKKLQVNLDHLVAKAEVTPGVQVVLADADYDVRLRDIVLTLDVGVDNEAQKNANGSHAGDQSIMGAKSGSLSFWHWVVWGGAVATEPNWWKYQYGCGGVKTAYGATGIALHPEKSADRDTLTMSGYRVQRGSSPVALTFEFAGCMGNCILTSEGIGQPWRANYNFQGKVIDVTDTAFGSILDQTGLDTTIAEKLLANTFTAGGTAGSISKFALNYGNVIEMVDDQSDATGIEYFGISRREPEFSCDPFMQLEAEDDAWSIMNAQTFGALALTSGNPTGNLKISAPRAQLMPMGIAARNGSAVWDKTYRLLENTAGGTVIEKERTWQFLQGAVA